MKNPVPYLIRAFHECITDSDLTPHIYVDATCPGVIVPDDQITNGKIILNIAASATNGILLGNETVEFKARFFGEPFFISIPINAILAIYAKENGQGMIFDSKVSAGLDTEVKPVKNPKPALRLVK